MSFNNYDFINFANSLNPRWQNEETMKKTFDQIRLIIVSIRTNQFFEKFPVFPNEFGPVIFSKTLETLAFFNSLHLTQANYFFLKNLLKLLQMMNYYGRNNQNYTQFYDALSNFIEKSDIGFLPIITSFLHDAFKLQSRMDENMNVEIYIVKRIFPTLTSKIEYFLQNNAAFNNHQFIFIITAIDIFSAGLKFYSRSAPIYENIFKLLNFLSTKEQTNQLPISLNAKEKQMKIKITQFFLMTYSIKQGQSYSIESLFKSILENIKLINFKFSDEIVEGIMLANHIISIYDNPSILREFLNDFEHFSIFLNTNIKTFDSYMKLYKNVLEKAYKNNILDSNDINSYIKLITNLLNYDMLQYARISWIQVFHKILFENTFTSSFLILYGLNIQIIEYAYEIEKIDLINILNKISIYKKINQILVFCSSIIKIFGLYFTKHFKDNERINFIYDPIDVQYLTNGIVNFLFFTLYMLFKLTREINPNEQFSMKTNNIIEFYDFFEEVDQKIDFLNKYQSLLNQMVQETINIISSFPIYLCSSVWDHFFMLYFSKGLNHSNYNLLGTPTFFFQNNYLIIINSSFLKTVSEKNKLLETFLLSLFNISSIFLLYSTNISLVLDSAYNIIQNLSLLDLPPLSNLSLFNAYNNFTEVCRNFLTSYKTFQNIIKIFTALLSLGYKLFDDLISNSSITQVSLIQLVCSFASYMKCETKDVIIFLNLCCKRNNARYAHKFVVYFLIKHIQDEPTIVLNMLNSIKKVDSNLIYKNPFSTKLMKKCALLLNIIKDKKEKLIILKFLKHANKPIFSSPNSIFDYQNHDNTSLFDNQHFFNALHKDFFSSKQKIVFESNQWKYEFNSKEFFQELENCIKINPTDQFLIDIYTRSISAIFNSQFLSCQQRKFIIMSLNNVFDIFSSLENNDFNLISEIFTRIQSLTHSSIQVCAHIFSSLCNTFYQTITSFIFRSDNFLNNNIACKKLNDIIENIFFHIQNQLHFKNFLSELQIISDFQLFYIQHIKEVIAMTIITKLEISVIDPVSFLIFNISFLSNYQNSTLNNATKISLPVPPNSNGTYKLTFPELEELDCFSKYILFYLKTIFFNRPSSLSSILSIISSNIPLNRLLIFFEFISNDRIDKEIIDFFNSLFDNSQNIESLAKIKLIALFIRAFPTLFETKSDKIFDIFNQESNHTSSNKNFQIELLLLLNSILMHIPDLNQLNTSSINLEYYFNVCMDSMNSKVNKLIKMELVSFVYHIFTLHNSKIDLLILNNFNKQLSKYNDTAIPDFSQSKDIDFLLMYSPIYHDKVFKLISSCFEKFISMLETSQTSNFFIISKSIISFFEFLSMKKTLNLLLQTSNFQTFLIYMAKIYVLMFPNQCTFYDKYFIKIIDHQTQAFIDFINTQFYKNDLKILTFLVLFLDKNKEVVYSYLKNYKTLNITFELKEDQPPITAQSMYIKNFQYDQNKMSKNQNYFSNFNIINQTPDMISKPNNDNLQPQTQNKTINTYFNLNYQVIIQTYLNKKINADIIEFCIINLCKLFHHNISMFRPLIFDRLCYLLINASQDLFIKNSNVIINTGSPIIINQYHLIFIANIDKISIQNLQMFQPSKNEQINIYFIKKFVLPFYLQNITKQKEVILFINNHFSLYTFSAFLIELLENFCELLDDKEINQLTNPMIIYQKATSDDEYFIALLYWSKLINFKGNTDNNKLSQMFLNLIQFLSITSHPEAVSILKDIIIPNGFRIPNEFLNIFEKYISNDKIPSSFCQFFTNNKHLILTIPIDQIEIIASNIEKHIITKEISRIHAKLPQIKLVFKYFLEYIKIRIPNPMNTNNVGIPNDMKYMIQFSENLLKIVMNQDSQIGLNLTLLNQFLGQEVKIMLAIHKNTQLLDDVFKFYKDKINENNTKIIKSIISILPNIALAVLTIGNDEKYDIFSIINSIGQTSHWVHSMKALIKIFERISKKNVSKINENMLIKASLILLKFLPKKGCYIKNDNLKPIFITKNYVLEKIFDFCFSEDTSNFDKIFKIILMNMFFSEDSFSDFLKNNNISCKSYNSIYAILLKKLDQHIFDLNHSVIRIFNIGLLLSNNDFFLSKVNKMLEQKNSLNQIYQKKLVSYLNAKAISKLSNLAKLNISVYFNYLLKDDNELIQFINGIFHTDNFHNFNQEPALFQANGYLYNLLKNSFIFVNFFDSNKYNALNSISFLNQLNSKKLTVNTNQCKFPYLEIKMKSSFKILEFISLDSWEDNYKIYNIDFKEANIDIYTPLLFFMRHGMNERVLSFLCNIQNIFEINSIDKNSAHLLQYSQFLQSQKLHYSRIINSIVTSIFSNNNIANIPYETLMNNFKTILERELTNLSTYNFYEFLSVHSTKYIIQFLKNQITQKDIFEKIDALFTNTKHCYTFSSDTINHLKYFWDNIAKYIPSIGWANNIQKMYEINEKITQKLRNEIIPDLFFREGFKIETSFNLENLKEQENSLENLFIMIFLSSNIESNLVTPITEMLLKALKLNCSNDTFLDVLISHYQLFIDKLEDFFQIIKRIPFHFSQRAIELVVSLKKLVSLQRYDYLQNFILQRLHPGFYINAIKSLEDTGDLNTEVCIIKTSVYNFLNPIIETLSHPCAQEIVNLRAKEDKIIQCIQNKQYIDMLDCEKNIESQQSFLLESRLISRFPAPLLKNPYEEKAYFMILHKSHPKNMFLTLILSMFNGKNAQYSISPMVKNEISLQRFSLFTKIISNILKKWPESKERCQRIDSIIYSKITDEFCLIHTDDIEPLYLHSIIKLLSLYECNKDPPTEKKYNQVCNFLSKQEFVKWFWLLGSSYSCLAILQIGLNVITPLPNDIYISKSKANIILSHWNNQEGNLDLALPRMCGKMKWFCNRYVAYGPFKNGVVSATDCFLQNRYKITQLMNSILNVPEIDIFDFFDKRIAAFSARSIDNNDKNLQKSTDDAQKSIIEMIDKAWNLSVPYVIPWI